MFEKAKSILETFKLRNNLLVNQPEQPFNAPPLGLAKPEHVEPAVDWALKRAKNNIIKITNSEDAPTFENTIAALAFSSDDLESVLTPFWEMTDSLNTEEVQKTSATISPKLTEYSTEVSLNTNLFKRIKSVYDTADRNKLSTEEQALLDDTYHSFKNNGALLEGQGCDEYKELCSKLSELTLKYGNNLTNSAGNLKVVITANDATRLDGIPQDVIDTYRQNAIDDPDEVDDAYVITMTPPPIDVYEYANDRTLREKVKRVSEKIGSEGEFDNTQNVMDILKIRHKIAKILGFEHHADKTIRKDTRMTENYQTAMDFVKNSAETYYPVAKKFYEELAEFAKQKDNVTELKPWDKLYYIRLMREEQIGFDPEAVRPYFELESSLKGLFEHAEKLYGISVKEVEHKYSKAHDDVRTYEITDIQSGEVKALFLLDPYARKDKRSGAWMSQIRGAGLHNGKQEIPVIGNYCNFMKPTTGNPSLLTDNDVITLWHEFGHACHGIMGKGDYPDLTGTNTPWDYVELPSQINECWAFKPEVLATYAKHHETGELIPQDLVDKLQKLNAFDARWQGLRQTELGLLDMELYTTNPDDIGDLLEFQNKIWGPTELTAWNGPAMVLNFSHIISGGYSAGYYSYKWADAVVADVFEQFEKQGIYKKTLCNALSKCMVEPGGIIPPSTMHKDFMEAAGQGRRELDSTALFRREGLLPEKKSTVPELNI